MTLQHSLQYSLSLSCTNTLFPKISNFCPSLGLYNIDGRCFVVRWQNLPKYQRTKVIYYIQKCAKLLATLALNPAQSINQSMNNDENRCVSFQVSEETTETCQRQLRTSDLAAVEALRPRLETVLVTDSCCWWIPGRRLRWEEERERGRVLICLVNLATAYFWVQFKYKWESYYYSSRATFLT